MFDGIVRRYDVVNDVLSFGMDRSWRRATARAIDVPVGALVLDLGCGTGKLGALLRGRRVLGVDTSLEMLRHAAAAERRQWFVQASAFALPFADGSLDAATSGFVLRNLDDLAGAFSELARVLRPGAPVALVDATEPASPAFRRLFDRYFAVAAPALGTLVGRRDAYRYLVRSLAHLPDRGELCRMLEAAGFEGASFRSFAGGAATLWIARRRG